MNSVFNSLALTDGTGNSISGASITPVDAQFSEPPAGASFSSTLCTTTFLVTLGEEAVRSIAIDASGALTYAEVACTQAKAEVVYGNVPKHTVTVINGTGSRTDVPVGEEVTVKADAGDFYFWKVECTGDVDVYVEPNATATFTMPDADITLTAIYYAESTTPEPTPTPSTTPSTPTPGTPSSPTPGTTPSNPAPSATTEPSQTPSTQPTPVQAVYDITIDKDLKNGSVKITSGATSVTGKEVTFTVTPDAGYKIGTVSVTDKAGKKITVKDLGDGKYSFVMPEGTVKIDVTFEAVTVPHVCPADKFTDLDTSLWYHDAVDYVLTNGLMKGVSETEFAPLQTTDRAMLTTILYNVEKRPPVTNASSFEDVGAGKWYADPIAWAQANKVVAGTSETTFEPERHITREQMAVMLYNYAVLKGYDVSKTGTLESYTDADELSGWAETAMCWATANGILKGVSSDPTAPALNPQGESTRVEMAALIMNFLQTFAAEKTAE